MGMSCHSIEIYALPDGSIDIVSIEQNREHKPEKGAIKLNSVMSLNVHLKPSKPVTADVEMLVVFDAINADPTYKGYVAFNPKTKEMEAVKSINFESGDVWDG